MKENYFKFFTNCIIVKGINRSLIVDIQRGNFLTIPDTMHHVINSFKLKKSILEIKKDVGTENSEIIDEYIDFLIDHDFGMIVDYNEFDFFIEMDTVFDIPSLISNAIVEISNVTLGRLSNIFQDLDQLFCKHFQIISYEKITVNQLKQILISTNIDNVRSLELIMPFSEEIINFIKEIDKINFRVTNLILHSKKNNKEIILPKTTFPVMLLNKNINSCKGCGVINFEHFCINKFVVFESFNHNSCLNKKISIDKEGYIRNCPSMPQSFGNIKDTTLEEALNHPDFKKYWNVTKDMIQVCKDCEFRHICTDCRAYTERTHFEEDIDLSKPLKCGYNPYTNEWAEWSTNPLKQKAIEYYGMQELVKKEV